MSKYIDAERLNMEWQTLKPFGVTDTMIENLKWIVDRQPTIEVSEDCISRVGLFEKMQSLCPETDKGCGDCHKVCDIEDCLDFVMNAPSVVPTGRKNRQVERAEGEWVGMCNFWSPNERKEE